MRTQLLAALEAFWAAKTFNRLSELVIKMPFTESEIKRIAQVNNIDFDVLEETVLYDNTTVQEYTVLSVERCFSIESNNKNILIKRKSIEDDLKSCQALLKLPLTA